MFESILILPVPLEKVDFLVSCKITLRCHFFQQGIDIMSCQVSNMTEWDELLIESTLAR